MGSRILAATLIVAAILGRPPGVSGSGEPTFVTAWGSFGTTSLNFRNPTGIGVAPDGSVYVADFGNYRIKRFTNEGAFLSEWVVSDGAAQNPWDVAVDQDGIVFVTVATHRVFKYSPDGVLLDIWGSPGTCDGMFVTPISIAVGEDGQVYVADFNNGRIQKFTHEGEFLAKWGSWSEPCRPDGYPTPEFVPVGVATFPPSQVLTIARVISPNLPSNQRSMTVQRTNDLGALISEIHTAAVVASSTVEPFGVAIAPSGEVFVSDTQSYRVRWYDVAGLSLGTIGNPGSGPAQFFEPWDVAVDADGDLFVLDSGNHRVQKFTFATTDVAPVERGPVALRAWPNPARGGAVIEFQLLRAGPSTVTVFDPSGRLVTQLDGSVHAAGTHRVRWNVRRQDGTRVPPGIYLYAVEADGFAATGRLVVLPDDE